MREIKIKLFELLNLLSLRDKQSIRNILVVVVGVAFLSMSVISINNMVKTLRDKEIHDVEIWVEAMKQASNGIGEAGVPNMLKIANTRQNIPFIVLDEQMNVIVSHLVSDDITQHPDKLRRQIRKLTEINRPIEFQSMWGNNRYFLLYGTSQLLNHLSYIPYVQYCLLIIFFLFAYIALRSTKQGEQDRVWVGLAKETAHQLGTPISSLMGWLDYLRDQDAEPEAVDEMAKDLARLMKVADRFSKIGSETPLAPKNVNEVVDGVVRYFRGRMPRSVKLTYNGLSMAPATSNLNETLFEWVVENLLKNSLDALQGAGSIDVSVVADEHKVVVDVSDTGRGIAKGSWRKIFEPGFTTKSRGWGLGLSLSRRIVEDYHFGKIQVVASEIGVGTTIRVTLDRVFDDV
ncbi:MAG: HAMP domain-containing sensor histidine kinase [Rikenellaceae bacterium]